MHGQLRTLLLEDILYFKSTVFCSRFQLIKNPDVSIATKSLPLYSKIKGTSNKAFKSKENNIKALKKNKPIYLCTKQEEKKMRARP